MKLKFTTAEGVRFTGEYGRRPPTLDEIKPDKTLWRGRDGKICKRELVNSRDES